MSLPAGVTNRIIFVRHGEPVAAARGTVYGKLDVGLSKNGEAQVTRTAEWLKRFEITQIYTSPRVRATESARIVAETLALPVIIENRFAEIDFGDFEGATYDEVKARFPDIYELWMTRPTEVEFPNGESFTIMQRRVLAAIDEIKTAHQNQTAAIFAHGGVNRIAVAAALDLPPENLFRLEQNYGGANVIDFYGDFPVARIVNHNFAEF